MKKQLSFLAVILVAIVGLSSCAHNYPHCSAYGNPNSHRGVHKNWRSGGHHGTASKNGRVYRQRQKQYAAQYPRR